MIAKVVSINTTDSEEHLDVGIRFMNSDVPVLVFELIRSDTGIPVLERAYETGRTISFSISMSDIRISDTEP